MPKRRPQRPRRPFEIWPGYVDALTTLLMVMIFLLLLFVSRSSSCPTRSPAATSALEQLEPAGRPSSPSCCRSRRRRLGAAGSTSPSSHRCSFGRRASATGCSASSSPSPASATRCRSSGATAEHLTSRTPTRYRGATRPRSRRCRQHRGAREPARRADEEARTRPRPSTEQAAQRRRQALRGAAARGPILNAQLTALRQQLARLDAALDASEAKAKEQQAQIVDLGQKLNRALASKVEELARYRSEFFGKLREALAGQRDVQIVGDRFVFQSEVLFPPGSAELQPGGEKQLASVAPAADRDRARIPRTSTGCCRSTATPTTSRSATSHFPSNWELSTARAIAVVKFLHSQGIPNERLVAAGYGEYQPLAAGTGEEVYRRNRRIELKLDQR